MIARTSLITLIFLSPGVGQNDREFGLFRGRSGGGGSRSGGSGHRSGGGNAPFFFQELGEVRGFQNGQGDRSSTSFSIFDIS